MIDAYYGSVQTWECDQMGHMNVQFYVARASDALAHLGHAMGLGPSYAREHGAALVARDHHIKFLREIRPGQAFSVHAAVLGASGDVLRVYNEFRSSVDNSVLTTVVAEVTLVDLRTRETLPLPKETVARVPALAIELPEPGRPRGLAIYPPRPAPSIEEAEELGLFQTYQGVLQRADCDVHGFMETAAHIARISEAIPNLVSRASGTDRSDGRSGGAALEYRLIYRGNPRAGDLLKLYSALKEVGGKTYVWGHWLFDLTTGECVSTAEAVAVMLDLKARKVIAFDAATRRRLDAIVVPGLGV